MLGVVSSNLTIFKLSQRHPTYRNRTTERAQHVALNNMLRLHVAIVWSGLQGYRKEMTPSLFQTQCLQITGIVGTDAND